MPASGACVTSVASRMRASPKSASLTMGLSELACEMSTLRGCKEQKRAHRAVYRSQTLRSVAACAL